MTSAGSPNGAAFAYFLMQHKAQLGDKTITKVTVIRPENEDPIDLVDPSLVFHVANVPPPPANGGHAAKVQKRRAQEKVEVVQQGKNNVIRTHKFEI